MTQDNIEVPMDETWELKLTEKIQPEYNIAYKISNWLKNNLSGLRDDNNNILFNKVNLGFDENNLKSFGVKPVCDVYINNVEYDVNYDPGIPAKVNSIIIFYSKGTSDNSYLNACKLHDYIMQEFNVNENFQCLASVVSGTYITNSQIMTQPIRKKWGIMGTFELSHQLF